MNTLSPFHQGELTVQKLAQESDITQRNGGVISNKILPGAMPFIGQQNMLVVSSLDNQGNVWVSILMGKTGFISAPDTTSLLLDTTQIISQRFDPLWKNIETNPKVGLLAIELSTRRRYRVNGSIRAMNDTHFSIAVEQAYPNCPKYIQRRNLNITDTMTRQNLPQSLKGSALTIEHIELIKNADSLFVGSASYTANEKTRTDDNSINTANEPSCDASHRGGLPGFVEIIDGKRLRIPDYQGNSLFNTLGNIQTYPKAGVVFIDFERGYLLQVSGAAKILWNQTDPHNKTGGTQRFWELTVEVWQQSKLPTELSWDFFDYSPHNPKETPVEIQPVENLSLKVSRIGQKSETIKQYRLVADDGGILPAFEPGSHLPISVTLPDGQKIERYYSILSSHHDNRYYEIAVQREEQGRGGSKFIHQHFTTNTLITAKPPRNEFPLSPIRKHTILIAGGIGITPILSMLRALVENHASFEIHYTARTQADLAFSEEVTSLAGEKAQVYFSKGKKAKRLDLESVMKQRDSDTHIFLCGPVRMIEAVRDLGDTLNYDPGQIHFESFGASLSTNDSEIEVILKKSSQVIKVKPSQTILEALIKSKVSVPYDCKRGECGLCATGVVEGEVDHRDVYLNQHERKQQMCVCVSRAKRGKLTLDL